MVGGSSGSTGCKRLAYVVKVSERQQKVETSMGSEDMEVREVREGRWRTAFLAGYGPLGIGEVVGGSDVCLLAALQYGVVSARECMESP